MAIETRIQSAVETEVAKAETRLHEDLHAAVRRLQQRIDDLEAAIRPADSPAPSRARRTARTEKAEAAE
jgi:hypothetical protein